MKSNIRAFSLLVGATIALLNVNYAHAAAITFTDVNLASGNPVTIGGTTLTTTNSGGSIGFIGSGTFTGLHLGGSNTSGLYTFTFSNPITFLEFEFDALSDVGSLPVETIFGFSTNTSGGVTVGYTNQFGTTFDGTTITSTENDGQGFITFSGAAFTAFSFNHNQGAQSGFVVERMLINTGAGIVAVPEPSTYGLVGAGVLALCLIRRKRRA